MVKGAERILVTGGSGFIGTNIIENYKKKNCAVINLDKTKPRNTLHRKYWKRIDIRNYREVTKIFREFKPTIVFHLAARTDLSGKSIEEYSANTIGVRNVVRSINESASVNYAIYASSMLVCRLGHIPVNEEDYCPSTMYGHSKVEGERIVRDYADGCPWTIIRPTSIWGPWFQEPYRNFFKTVKRGLYVHPGSRIIRRSYGFVLNTVHQMDKLYAHHQEHDVHGKSIYIADYVPTEIKTWANVIRAKYGRRPVREVPENLLRFAGIVGDRLVSFGWRNFPMTSFRLKNMLTDAIMDLEAIKKVAPVLPYDLDTGVDVTVTWMEQH